MFFTYAALYHFTRTLGEHKTLFTALSCYVNGYLAEKALKDKSMLQTGGTMTNVVAMFIDLKDFTGLCEKMSQGGLIALLNKYFTSSNAVALKNMATILKIGGDSAYYIWGAPVPIPNSKQLAIQTAVEIRRGLMDLFSGDGLQPGGFRIGFHYGPAEVGNIGSPERLDYTAVQDAVNIASRIEGLDKKLGMGLLFSRQVVEGSGFEEAALFLGSFLLMGKTNPIEIFTIPLNEIPESAKKLWKEALRKFRQRDWDAAWAHFTESAKLAPELKATAHIGLRAIIKYRNVPPNPAWAGEFILSNK